MKARRLTLLLAPLAVMALVHAGRGTSAAPQEIRWKKTVLDTHFRSEDCAVADVNKDGKMDVMVGDAWYEAPDWKMHEIRPLKEYTAATGYSNAFLVFAYDVDHDGWTDQVVVGFPGSPAVWDKNPGSAGGRWQEFPITDSACNESPVWADVDGDGKPELVTAYQEKQMAYYKPGRTPEKGWEQHLIGAPDQPGVKRFSHGLGVGDVNGDGRADIICTDGYYEAPKDRNQIPWKFVPAKLGPACSQMYTFDFNLDGKPDVISSSAHAIGVWWWEQNPGPNGPEFKQHEIDNSFSESHALMTADINGDGHPDFVTGKRWWAHGPNGDVNPNDPAVLYWFEWKRENGNVAWTKHLIDSDSGVGTGFKIADMNRDRRPDIIVSNKKGVFLIEQVK